MKTDNWLDALSKLDTRARVEVASCAVSLITPALPLSVLDDPTIQLVVQISTKGAKSVAACDYNALLNSLSASIDRREEEFEATSALPVAETLEAFLAFLGDPTEKKAYRVLDCAHTAVMMQQYVDLNQENEFRVHDYKQVVEERKRLEEAPAVIAYVKRIDDLLCRANNT